MELVWKDLRVRVRGYCNMGHDGATIKEDREREREREKEREREIFLKRKTKGVAINVYLWKTSEK